MIKFGTLILFLLSCFNLSIAQELKKLTTPSFLSDNMVLQQNDTVAIWGKDAPDTKVSVSGSWGKDGVGVTNKSGK